jgi:hypothetical protein
MTETQLSVYQQGRLEEFRAVHEEMMYALRERVWGIASFAALSAVLIVFAEKNSAAWLHFAAVCLAVPFLLYTVYLERVRLRISAYIRAVTEKAVPGMSWEGDLRKWRTGEARASSLRNVFDRTRYVTAILGVYDVVAGLSFARFMALSGSPYKEVALIPLLLVLLCSIWLFVVLASYGRYFNRFEDMEKARDKKPKKPAGGDP